jgi:rhodanese-related sulfurtransferase
MSKVWQLFAVLFLAFVVAGGVQAQDQPFTMLTMQQVSEVLGKPGVYLFDANMEEIYEQHHLPGATHVTPENLRKSLPRDKNAMVIFYCADRRCTASEGAARDAAKLGYNKVYTMPEGIFGWVKSGRPTSSVKVPAKN